MKVEECLQLILQEPWVKHGYIALVLRSRLRDHGIEISYKEACKAVGRKYEP